jgi:ribonuclease Z
MKITFLGTGCCASERRRCTSFLIGDNVLFDVGHGIVTALWEHGRDVRDIETLIITHFHIDHVGDLPYLLYRRFSRCLTQKKLTIIAPKGFEEWFVGYANHQLNTKCKEFKEFKRFGSENIEVIELGDNEGVLLNKKFGVSAFAVEHGDSLRPYYGYIIEKDGVTLGCSGDTRWCESLENQIHHADAWVIDCSRLHHAENDRHMSLEMLNKVAKDYPHMMFYAVHRKDWEIPTDAQKNIAFPMDGDVIKIKV